MYKQANGCGKMEKQMTTETNEKVPAKLTGRKYASVDALMREGGVSEEVRSKVAAMESDTRIALQLAKLRQRAGMTQEDMAKHFGLTQGAISKLESGHDDEITLREIREYARATGQRVNVMFGKPFSHVEAVKLHAYGIKHRLEALAAIANQNDDHQIKQEIRGFFGEAFFNILEILSVCNNMLPSTGNEFEVKMEVIKDEGLTTAKAKTTSREPIAV